MSLTDEIERFRVEALGRVYQDLEIIEGVTGYVRDMDEVRSRFADKINHVVARGPELPPGAPLSPWPVNDGYGPTGYPQTQPAGLGPPPPHPYDGSAYAPPPPPPGYYPNGNGAGYPPQPPPLHDTPMRDVLDRAGNPPRR
jgi:hypothetical protein